MPAKVALFYKGSKLLTTGDNDLGQTINIINKLKENFAMMKLRKISRILKQYWLQKKRKNRYTNIIYIA